MGLVTVLVLLVNWWNGEPAPTGPSRAEIEENILCRQMESAALDVALALFEGRPVRPIRERVLQETAPGDRSDMISAMDGAFLVPQPAPGNEMVAAVTYGMSVCAR